MKRYLRSLGSLAVLCIFCGAAWLLYREIRKYSFIDIRHSLELIPLWRIGASFALMVLNYLILVGYDALALKAISRKLSLGKTALVSFVGCACSYNFGALLGGSSVRYRLYTAWGFPLHDIVRLILMLAVTFWVGALGLAGLAFLIEPLPLPQELNLPVSDVRPLGGFLLLLTCTYLGLTFFVRKPLHIFGKDFALPCPKIAFQQTIVACADLVAAAGCLYMLMPEDLGLDFLTFLSIYLLAMVVVVLTHVPGGAGVFELVILSLSQTSHPQAVIAALLAFRVIYYLLPLLFAASLLAGYEVHLRRHLADTALREAGRWIHALAHTLLAYITFTAGVILILSGSLPDNEPRVAWLATWIPFAVQNAAHLIASMTGVGLLLLSRGIERRLSSAWRIALLLVGAGILCSLLKGLDWHEAILLSLIFIVLACMKGRFYKTMRLGRKDYPPRWMFAAVAVIMTSGVVALLVHGQSALISGVQNLLDPLADAPQALRNLMAALLVFVLFLIRRMFLPLHTPHAGPSPVHRKPC